MKKYQYKSKQQGLTLVELLVALVLGLVLVGTLVQSYLSTKQTYRLTEGVGRVQESSRFALHFLTTDIRKAGNLGCIDKLRNKLNNSDEINFTSPIIGWDYTGTDSADTAFQLPTALSFPAEANWSGVTAGLPDSIKGSTGANQRVVVGSDVIIINSVSETNVVLNNIIADRNAALLNTQGNHDFPDNQLLVVGDCLTSDLFQHSGGGNSEIVPSQDNTLRPGNDALAEEWAYQWGPDSTIHEVSSAAYYVGIGASGVPSLFRLPLNTGTSVASSTPIELVEGVETVQFLYGEDLINTDNIRKPNRYVSADQVGSWQDVVSVRIGMVMRSPENATDEDQAASYTVLDTLEISHQNADDRILRYALNSTIKPRNRGVARTYTVCDPNDPSDLNFVGCGGERALR